MCDKKNSVLFTDTECVVLSPDFKLLRVPRKYNMYCVDLKNIVPSGGIVNLIDLKVKVIRCDNGSEFKNKVMNQFCEMKAKHQGMQFNSRSRIVKENLHVKFSEETPNIAGNGPNWLFDIDAPTKSMNYKPVVAGNQTNGNAGTKENINAGQAGKKTNEDSEVPNTEEPRVKQEQNESVNNTNNINIVNITSIEDNDVDDNIVYGCIDDPNMRNLEEIVFSDDDEEVDVEADMTNLNLHILVTPTPTTRIHKDHPLEQMIGDIHPTPQTRRMIKSVTDHEPKKVIQDLTDLSWIEAMQDELL
ncbi:hypothetical protein Tco_0980557 [Tanacetum coccineum]